jgi:hypothetical protein
MDDLLLLLVASLAVACSSRAEPASPAAAQAAGAPSKALSRIDGYEQFKFGLTLHEIESRKLCSGITRAPGPVNPPEDAIYSCTGVPTPNRDSDSANDTDLDLTFVKGRLAAVALSSGNSLRDFTAAQRSLAARYGEWYGDEVEPSAARRPEIQASRTEAFTAGRLERLVRNFARGAVRLTALRPDPQRDVLVVRVAYVDLPAYAERSILGSNSP